MLVLGINGGFCPGYQDTSAVLIQNGKVLCAVEEERFNRIKYSPGQIPERSIQWILERERLSIQDINLIGTHGVTFGQEFEQRLKNYFYFRFKHSPAILKVHHHLAHSASTYYASGFSTAMILTVDNSGDGISTQTAIGSNGKIKILKQYKRPQSLGLFYSMMTQFCGFLKDSDEYKLMGLSAYGKPIYDLNFLLSVKKGGYELNEDYLSGIKPGQPQPSKQEALFSNQLIKRLNFEPRRPEKPITEDYKNLSASTQQQLEKALIEIVTDLYNETKIKNLCLAGGVALNCLANQKLAQLDFIENIYIQPASSDAGISLGGAYLAALELGDKTVPMGDVYLGPSYSDSYIFKELESCGISFKKLKDPAITAVEKILKGNIVGWHQGAMEFGPRALGARSILADPFDKNMKDKVNSKVKFRESFRPFGPSLLCEDKEEILESPLKELPFMTITANVKEPWKTALASITHRDGTTRPQTCDKKQNLLYWSLLKAMKNEKGRGVVLNTSFNQNHEPIINSPKEALAGFFSSGMDCVIIGSFLIEKGA